MRGKGNGRVIDDTRMTPRERQELYARAKRQSDWRDRNPLWRNY